MFSSSTVYTVLVTEYMYGLVFCLFLLLILKLDFGIERKDKDSRGRQTDTFIHLNDKLLYH